MVMDKWLKFPVYDTLSMNSDLTKVTFIMKSSEKYLYCSNIHFYINNAI